MEQGGDVVGLCVAEIAVARFWVYSSVVEHDASCKLGTAITWLALAALWYCALCQNGFYGTVATVCSDSLRRKEEDQFVL